VKDVRGEGEGDAEPAVQRRLLRASCPRDAIAVEEHADPACFYLGQHRVRAAPVDHGIEDCTNWANVVVEAAELARLLDQGHARDQCIDPAFGSQGWAG